MRSSRRCPMPAFTREVLQNVKFYEKRSCCPRESSLTASRRRKRSRPARLLRALAHPDVKQYYISVQTSSKLCCCRVHKRTVHGRSSERDKIMTTKLVRRHEDHQPGVMHRGASSCRPTSRARVCADGIGAARAGEPAWPSGIGEGRAAPTASASFSPTREGRAEDQGRRRPRLRHHAGVRREPGSTRSIAASRRTATFRNKTDVMVLDPSSSSSYYWRNQGGTSEASK
jgi:hypothetical protein